MDDSLPIPEATMKRDGRYQDAARLYIHQRVTNFAELARMCNLPNSIHLLRVKTKDKWDDFVGAIATNTLSSVWGNLGILHGWHPERLAEVKAERERQIAQIPKLREELERIALVIPTLDIGSKAHSAACSSLRVLGSLLADYSGLDRWFTALQKTEKKEHQPGDARDTRGVLIDL